MTSKREVDPEARRLLGALDRIEAEPWPGGMAAYAEALQALAVRCEAKPGKAEMYRWMLRELVGAIYAHDGRWATARLDAVAVMATTSAGLLMQWRAALDPGRRPNLRSMAGALLGWRGKDDWVSHEARHRAHLRPWRLDFTVPVSARQETRLIADEVCRILAAGGPPEQALLRLGMGDSTSEAARRTGASRQQVYRARGRLLERLGIPVDGRPIGQRGMARATSAADDEPDPDGDPGSPVVAAGRAHHEAGPRWGTDEVDQVPDLHRRSRVRSPDPPPVRPRPTPLARRPTVEGARPTPTAGTDRGRMGLGRRSVGLAAIHGAGCAFGG